MGCRFPPQAEAKEAKEEAKVEATTVHSRQNQAVWESGHDTFASRYPRFAVPSAQYFALLVVDY